MSKTELLRFNDNASEYIEKEFTVAAIVKRPIAKNDYYIGDSGNDTVDIIMPNDKLKENYNVSGYNSISINLKNKSDNNKIVKQICKATTGLNRCMVKEGICYGLCTCISLLVMYLVVHRILQYIMQHVFLYIIVESNIMLPQCLFMIAVTISICVFTLFIAGNSILKDEIIEEI